MQVDLSLAINYIPACTCLAKMVIFMTCVIPIHQGEEIGVFSILSFILYMDRLVCHNIIFDSNSILLAVFFSNVHQLVRSVAPTSNVIFPIILLHIIWCGFCIMLLVEPPLLSRWIDRKGRAYTLIPPLIMVLVLTCLTFVREDTEIALIKFCRAIAFSLLCLIWIYLVGVNNTHSIEYLKDTSSQFISRMAPVLYSPIWISGIFCISSVMALLYQYIKFTKKIPVQEYPQQEICISTNQDHADTESGDVYELFKMAKHGGKLPLAAE